MYHIMIQTNYKNLKKIKLNFWSIKHRTIYQQTIIEFCVLLQYRL